MRRMAHSKLPQENEEVLRATLAALTVESDCVLDFYLERDSCDSGYCKTNEVFSVLIDSGPGGHSHKLTYAITA